MRPLFLLLAFLLPACAWNDPRAAVVEAPEDQQGAVLNAFEAWKSAEPSFNMTLGACHEGAACIGIQAIGAKPGDAGDATPHANGDCDIVMGNLKLSPAWRILEHELGHCLGLKHTTENCTDGAFDIMHAGDEKDMRICDPSLQQFKEIYGE